ncbi:MAG: phytase [Mangrovibacterium sp.]
MMNYIVNTTLSLIICSACISCTGERKSEGDLKKAAKIKLATTALYETDPMPRQKTDDAADDPAIWRNPKNQDEVYIIGTDKKGGLAIYNLKGETVNYYEDGKMNNVDVCYEFKLGADTIDIVASSNRTTKGISLYKITSGGILSKIGNDLISKMHGEVYGFCLYVSPKDQKYYAFVNSKNGEVEQWELTDDSGHIVGNIVRRFDLGTQTEGMIADNENQTIFIGEERKGIYKFNAEPDGSIQGEFVNMSSKSENKNIEFDIEGLSIYYLPEGDGYLLASSQGNYSYAVFNRKAPHKYIGNFRVTDGVVDGVEETDGIDIFSFPLNDDFKHGLFVAQDGFNYDGKEYKAQNFKLITWENIARLFNLKMN